MIRASIISLIALVATPALAQQAPPAAQEAPQASPTVFEWTATANLRPRAEFRYNNLFNLTPTTARYVRRDNGDSLSLRSRFGVGFDSPDFDGLLQLQHVSIWGATGGDETTDPSVGMHQAFVTWSPNAWWWLQLGRFELWYGDHRVLGAPGWNQTGRAWDGVRTGFWFADDIGLDLFAAAYNDGFLRSAPAYDDRIFEDDSMLTGLYFHSADLSDIVSEVDVYALGDLQFDQLNQAPQRQLLGTFGARVSGDFFDIEGAYQTGSRCVPVPVPDPRVPPTLECQDVDPVKVSAGFVDAEFGMTLGPIRPFLGGGYATGDNPDTPETNEAYFQMYPKVHKWLGYIDLVRRTNLIDGRVGATLKAGDLTVREAIHVFAIPQPQTEPVGLELDTTLSYQFHEMFSGDIGHAVFAPFDNGASVDPAVLTPTGVGSWWYVMFTFDAAVALNR